MPSWIDHALFLILAVFGPVWGATFGMRRLKRAAPEDLPRVRGSVYRVATIVQWSLAGALLLLWVAMGRPWGSLGLVPRPTWGLGGVTLGLLIVAVFALRQRAQILADDESLAEVRWKLRRLERMMPRSPAELRAFNRLSVTAGVCEELLYRGFLIWYLVHWFGLFPAAGLSAVVFGVGHGYQGWRGVLTTGAVGAFLAGVYLISGSLLVPMVLHALMDLHSGNLAFHAFARAPAESEDWGADAEAAEPWIEALEDAARSPDSPAASGTIPNPPNDGTGDGMGAPGEGGARPESREGAADVERS